MVNKADVGNVAKNTHMQYLFTLFIFSFMLVIPSVYAISVTHLGIGAIIMIIVLGMLGVSMVFFMLKKVQEATIMTWISIGMMELFILVMIILIIIGVVNVASD